MDQTGVADVRKDGAAGGRSRPAHEAAPSAKATPVPSKTGAMAAGSVRSRTTSTHETAEDFIRPILALRHRIQGRWKPEDATRFQARAQKRAQNGPGACALAQMGEYANRKPLSKWRIIRPQNKWQSCAYLAWEKMNRLALQNPPRQAEKRQCPDFLACRSMAVKKKGAR